MFFLLHLDIFWMFTLESLTISNRCSHWPYLLFRHHSQAKPKSWRKNDHKFCYQKYYNQNYESTLEKFSSDRSVTYKLFNHLEVQQQAAKATNQRNFIKNEIYSCLHFDFSSFLRGIRIIEQLEHATTYFALLLRLEYFCIPSSYKLYLSFRLMVGLLISVKRFNRSGRFIMLTTALVYRTIFPSFQHINRQQQQTLQQSVSIILSWDSWALNVIVGGTCQNLIRQKIFEKVCQRSLLCLTPYI